MAHDGQSNPRALTQRRPSYRRPSPSLQANGRKSSVSSATSTQQSLRSLSLQSSSPTTRLRKPSKQQLRSPLVNPWEYAALPEAIRRKQFSPDEQLAITSKISPVILDAADEALYKHFHRSRSTFSLRVPKRRKWSVEDQEDIASSEEEDRQGQEKVVEPHKRGHSVKWERMDARDLDSFKWLDADTELDLRLDDYHAISAEVNERQNSMSSHRKSFRRGLSFSNSFRRRSSSSTSSQQSPATLNQTGKKPVFEESNIFPQTLQHQRIGSTSSLDPSATHYQDPTAKMKLRVYLASPQKFDEALEFGFPTIHTRTLQATIRPQTSPEHPEGLTKSFLAEDTPSLSEDESRDERSEYMHIDSPRTPVEMFFPSRASNKSSIERSSHLRPRIVHHHDGYVQASASEREMTLKMTLTRPELRAIEQSEATNSPLINDIPLEKAPLHAPVGDARTIWDDLPEEPNRVKRFLKRLKGRS